MTKEEKIIDKIKKLLALATSPNENEAAAAADKAQALLAEHNLSIADVESKTSSTPEQVLESDPVEGKPMPWKRKLAQHVGQLYFCDYFYRTMRAPNKAGRYVKVDRHYFVGSKDNVVIAKLMFEYLVTTVMRLSRESALVEAKGERGRHRRSFRWGASGTLCSRLYERYLAAKAGKVKSEYTGTTLPALANLYDEAARRAKEYIEKQYPNMRTRKSRGRASSTAGYLAGREAGNRIGLDQQVKGGGKPSGLLN